MTNERRTDKQSAPPGLSLDDVYFVLFRRKWLILGLTVVGVAAAVAVYLALPTLYVSEAKLAVRYVLDTKSLPSANQESGDVKPTDTGGEGLISSEMEILKSLDLALEVATNIGPERILAKAGGGTNPVVAANVIAHGLTVEHPRFTMIIIAQFRHPDPTLVQPVLANLIQSYRTKHAEVHRPTGMIDDFLQQQTDRLRLSLQQDEDDLRRAKTNAGVISLDDTRRDLNARLSRLQDAIFAAQAEMAQREATLGEVQKLALSPTTAATNELAAPLDKLNQYRRLSARLDKLQNQEDDFLNQYTDDSPLVKKVRQEMADVSRQQQALEKQYPQLAALAPAAGSDKAAFDPSAEMARIKGLAITINVLSNQLDNVRSEAAKLDDAGVGILQLQRKRDLDEVNYRSYLATLDQARVYEAMGAGHVSNIISAQDPSPPVLDVAKKPKILILSLAAAILAPILLAFALELYVDRRIKRPGDVEKKTNLPLFMVIPSVKRHDHGRLLAAPPGPAPASDTPADAPLTPALIAPPSANGLKTYYDALRDRLMFYFHSRNMTHKPKLVGVTNCSRSAGATTVAAGLAAALSETGEGNVLLVDMNLPGGAAHPFYKGKPGCGLSDVLELGKRDDALVQDNLYLASAGQSSAGKSMRLLPKSFSDLMPKLKASDYDFIIFDLPPVSQTSATSNLAGMLDITFLVLEAEKTNQDTARRAAARFAESQANVAAVLNKARTRLPAWLDQGF